MDSTTNAPHKNRPIKHHTEFRKRGECKAKNGWKTCYKCGKRKRASIEKTITEFATSRSETDGFCMACKECCAAYAQRPEVLKRKSERYRTKKYGISPEEYNTMVETQGGVCLICHQPGDTRFGLVVDHDHDSGAIRGLLCANCNQGIGHLQDDPDRMRRAADYVAMHNWRKVFKAENKGGQMGG